MGGEAVPTSRRAGGFSNAAEFEPFLACPSIEPTKRGEGMVY